MLMVSAAVSMCFYQLTLIQGKYLDDIKADEFINKPIKLDRLVELIKHYI